MKKPPENPVLPEHRLAFESYLRLWQDRLALQSWRINLSAKKRPSAANAAEVKCYYADHLAEVRLTDDLGGKPPTPENLESYAVHELLHVLLAPLVHQEDSGLEGDALSAAEHRVIHVLQKLLTRGHI